MTAHQIGIEAFCPVHGRRWSRATSETFTTSGLCGHVDWVEWALPCGEPLSFAPWFSCPETP